MGFRCRCLVLLPDFDRLVTLGSDHTSGGSVEEDVENGSLAGKGSRLERRLDLLEVVARIPVKEVEGTVVSSTHHHVVAVNSK